MDTYFIRVKKGLFNQYYSESQSLEEITLTVQFKKAKVFTEVEDAQKIITDYNIEDSVIINQNGICV